MSANTVPCVIVEHKDRVSWIQLNRPTTLNAVNSDIVEGLITGLDEALAQQSQLVILYGVGKAFSAGFDLGALDEQSDADLLHRFVRVETLLQKLYMLPVTSLALVHGQCFGAAADMVAACRHRIATNDASFRMPGLQFGIVLGTRRLGRLIGDDAALSLLETSRIFTAQEAFECGFITQIAAKDDWPAIAASKAADAAALSIQAKATLLEKTRDDSALDSDMAALVRSASAPGLADRIRHFVNTQVKK